MPPAQRDRTVLVYSLGDGDRDGWHPRLQALHDYWRRIHPPGRLPGRQHLDPLDIPSLLPAVWMMDVVRDPFRLRYRLVGTTIDSVIGSAVTGRWMDEASNGPADWPRHYERYRAVADGRQVSWRRGPILLSAPADHHEVENLLLPLAADGATVDIILAITVYYDRHGRTL